MDYEGRIHDLKSLNWNSQLQSLMTRLTSKAAISCAPMVSSLNDNEIDFRISFDESDDEDYTVIFDKNSFSYKIISVNDLKTDSENDNEKVNMPSFPPPEPTDLVKEISTNIGGEFTNLEILKCWSLETSRRLFNTESCS
ncbi:hypothetical protein Tco_0065386 [Tanacetum coccineum]